MAWKHGNCVGYKEFLTEIVNFVTRDKEAGNLQVNAGNTGDGIVYGISGNNSSVAETITLTCTTAGGNRENASVGGAIFSVVGSIGGSYSDAEAAFPYSEACGSFTIIAGATDFVIGDSFTFDITTETPHWVVKHDIPNPEDATEREVILSGSGLSGNEEIFVGIRTYFEGTGCFRLGGFVGYGGSEVDFYNQPGKQPYECRVPLWADPSPIEFYIWDFKDGFKFAALVGTGQWEQGYLGFLERMASPSQYPYPLLVGGSSSTSTSHSDTNDDHCAYWKATTLHHGQGTLNIMSTNTWAPRDTSHKLINYPPDLIEGDYLPMHVFMQSPDGSQLMMDTMLIDRTDHIVYGRYFGIKTIFTDNHQMATKDIILRDGEIWIAMSSPNDEGELAAMNMN